MSPPPPSSTASSADPAHISALATTLATAASRLDADAVTLATGIRTVLTTWTGSAADSFRTYAASTDAARLAASSAMRAAALRLEIHAETLAARRATG